MKKRRIITVLLLFGALLPAVAQQPKVLSILQTSDTHSRLEPIDSLSADTYAGMGGTVRRAALIEQLRQKNPHTLLVDCGDFSQGTPYYNLFKGEVEVKMMNEMKYDVATIGNHEFDFGLDNLAHLYRMAKFPIVCANYEVKGTVLERLVKPSVILRKNGLKIGIFGLAPQMAGLVQADKYEGVIYSDPIVVANKIATQLKEVEKCDVVVCLSHLGIVDDKLLVGQTRHIDLLLGGHSHTFMKESVTYLNVDNKPVSVLHTGKSGVFVGKVDLTFE